MEFGKPSADQQGLFDGSCRQALRRRACPLAVCDCHIGYVHLETLPLYDVFAGGVPERIPAGLPVPAGDPAGVVGGEEGRHAGRMGGPADPVEA